MSRWFSCFASLICLKAQLNLNCCRLNLRWRHTHLVFITRTQLTGGQRYLWTSNNDTQVLSTSMHMSATTHACHVDNVPTTHLFHRLPHLCPVASECRCGHWWRAVIVNGWHACIINDNLCLIYPMILTFGDQLFNNERTDVGHRDCYQSTKVYSPTWDERFHLCHYLVEVIAESRK